MMMHTCPRQRPLRTVALVGWNPPPRVLDRLLGTADHDVVIVEPAARAYSRIKRAKPDLVVVCLSEDDMDGCQVLSMLRLDRETSRIPVVTFMTPLHGECEDEPAGDARASHVASVSWN